MLAGEGGPALPGSRPLTLTLAASAWRAHQRHSLFFVAIRREGAVRSGGADGNILQHRVTAYAPQRQRFPSDAGGADGSVLQNCGTPDAVQRSEGGSRATVQGCQAGMHLVQTPEAHGLPGTPASDPAGSSGRVAFMQLRRRQRRKVLDWDAAARKPRASQGLQARMPLRMLGTS